MFLPTLDASELTADVSAAEAFLRPPAADGMIEESVELHKYDGVPRWWISSEAGHSGHSRDDPFGPRDGVKRWWIHH